MEEDHVLVMTQHPIQPKDANEEAVVYGPATRETITQHLKAIGANPSANGLEWFDNDEPGIRYAVIRLVPMPVLVN